MVRLPSTALRQRYAQDGIVFPIRVLSPEEARSFRRACDELEQRLGGRPRTVDVRQMHLHYRWAWQLASHPRVLDAIEDVLGPDLIIWATELFAKHPHDGGVSIGWHRDEPYMGFDPSLTATAWIALSDSTPENGCMQVVIEQPDSGVEREQAAAAARLADRPQDSDQITSVTLSAGEMSLHSARILHGSGANRSPEKRVGFVVRYVRPDACPSDRPVAAVLARGRADGTRFQLQSPPVEADSDDALVGMKSAAAQHLDAMLDNLRRCRC